MQFKNQLILLIIGVGIGVLAIAQYQASPLAITTDKFNEVQDQKEILEELDRNQNMLKRNIATLRTDLDKLQSDDLRKEDLKALDLLKEKIGLTEIEGRGIRIIIDDSPDVIRENLDVNNDALVHAADLRDIVNLLRVSQAEAISINGQRILINATLSCVGNSILINNSHFLPPFQIDAIGDAEVLLTQLKNNLPAIYSRVTENNLFFSLETQEDLVIPVYNGDLGLNYTEKGDG